MNILDHLLQIVAVEIADSYLHILKRIAEEPEDLFRELGREQSAVLLKDLYDLCGDNKENKEFLLSTEFAKLVSGERKIVTGKIILEDDEPPKDPKAIAEEFHRKSQQIVHDMIENMEKIKKEN